MANSCEICGKTSWTGFQLSHSHRRSHRRWNPNLQRRRVLVNGVTPRRMSICTGCIRANKHLKVTTQKLQKQKEA